jgi:hypothetical protein
MPRQRDRRDVLRAAVGQGQHHHANGQQDTRGVYHPAADPAPGAYRIVVSIADHAHP